MSQSPQAISHRFKAHPLAGRSVAKGVKQPESISEESTKPSDKVELQPLQAREKRLRNLGRSLPDIKGVATVAAAIFGGPLAGAGVGLATELIAPSSSKLKLVRPTVAGLVGGLFGAWTAASGPLGVAGKVLLGTGAGMSIHNMFKRFRHNPQSVSSAEDNAFHRTRLPQENLHVDGSTPIGFKHDAFAGAFAENVATELEKKGKALPELGEKATGAEVIANATRMAARHLGDEQAVGLAAETAREITTDQDIHELERLSGREPTETSGVRYGSRNESYTEVGFPKSFENDPKMRDFAEGVTKSRLENKDLLVITAQQTLRSALAQSANGPISYFTAANLDKRLSDAGESIFRKGTERAQQDGIAYAQSKGHVFGE